jgi:hypothetical protein
MRGLGYDHRSQGSSEEVRRRRQDHAERGVWLEQEEIPVELGACTHELRNITAARSEGRWQRNRLQQERRRQRNRLQQERRRQRNRLQPELRLRDHYWERLDDGHDDIYAPHGQVWRDATDTAVYKEDAKILAGALNATLPGREPSHWLPPDLQTERRKRRKARGRRASSPAPGRVSIYPPLLFCGGAGMLLYTLAEGLGARYQAGHSPFAQPVHYYPEGKVHLFNNSSTKSWPRRVATSYLRKRSTRATQQ